MKICNRCNQSLLLSEFYKMKASPDGFTRTCRECSKSYSKGYREQNKDLLTERATVRGKHYAYKYILKTYGITLEEYEQLVETQNRMCAICFSVPDKLHVDHNHQTMEIRALLCGNCNRGIGMFKERPELLRAAAEFLEKKNGT